MQDIGGVDRQERSGSAKQNGEQIERDRGENQFVLADKIHAFQQRFSSGGRCSCDGLTSIAEAEETDERQTCAEELDDVNGSAADRGEKDSSRRRATDTGELLHAAVPGNRVAQRFGGNDVGQERLAGGPL